MTNDTSPHAPSEVVETLADLYRHHGNLPMVVLLESSEASIVFEEYDNWNGGQNNYSLQLKVPRKQFTGLEPRIESLQKLIAVKLGTVFKNTAPHFLTSVVITPLIKTTGNTRRSPAKPGAVERIWGVEGFRLFLSASFKKSLFRSLHNHHGITSPISGGA